MEARNSATRTTAMRYNSPQVLWVAAGYKLKNKSSHFQYKVNTTYSTSKSAFQGDTNRDCSLFLETK
jgi:hypothetical protein